MSISTSPAINPVGRTISLIILISSVLVFDTNASFATSSKNKTIKSTVVKSAKRSNVSTVINTLLNGIGAPSASIGINGDFYIDTITMNIYGPKKKNAWPIPKSLIGPQGVAGLPGKQGANGKDGRDGVNGKDGINGKDGERGAAGATGAPGASGEGAGVPGPVGPAGPAGPAGATGPSGPAGASGAAGATGAQGEVGPRGLQGIQGIQGETGPRGLQGLQGLQGDVGATGATGAAGAQGVQGIQGIQGVAGATGPARVIHGNTTALNLSTSSAGTGVTSQAIVTYEANKKYFFNITQFGTIGSTQNRKYFGMEVFASNSSNLKYSVTVTEAFSFRSGVAIHEYIFQALGTFTTTSSAGDLSYSIIDGLGITGAASMAITGNYQLVETNDILRIDQTNPATAIS